jgi:hypothetical protein
MSRPFLHEYKNKDSFVYRSRYTSVKMKNEER